MNDDEKKPLYQPVACPEVWGPAEVGGPDAIDLLWARLRQLEEQRDYWEKLWQEAEADYKQIRLLNNARLKERAEAFWLLREIKSVVLTSAGDTLWFGPAQTVVDAIDEFLAKVDG